MNLPARHTWIRTAAVPLLLALVAGSLVSAGGESDSAKSQRSTGDPAKGKRIFAVKCVACHRPDGSGGIKVTTVATPDWRDSTRMADPNFDDGYLRECITNGRLQSGMVAWSKQGVKAAEIENLIAYIRTFSARPSAAGAKPSAKGK